MQKVNIKYNNEFIEELHDMFQTISDFVFSTPEASIGKKGPYMIEGVHLMSVQNTLLSIDYCYGNNFFGDAFTLIRKYRDDLFQYLFLLLIVKKTKSLSNEEIKKYDLGSVDNVMKMVQADRSTLAKNKKKTPNELTVEAWIYGDLIKDSKYRNEFGAKKYYIYLKNNHLLINKLIQEYGLEQLWKNGNSILNDFVHGNGNRYIYANYIELNGSIKQYQELSIKCLQDITSIFLCILILIDASKIGTLDYLEHLEMGLIPPKDSQYYVNSYVMEYLESYISKIDTKLLDFLSENEGLGMKLQFKDYSKGNI